MGRSRVGAPGLRALRSATPTSPRGPVRLLALAALLLGAAALLGTLGPRVFDGGSDAVPDATAATPKHIGIPAPPEPKRVAPTIFVAPGATGEDCTAAAPCGSLDAALGKAKPGAGVQLAAGRYGPQILKSDARPAGSAPVVVRPAPGAKVAFEELRCGPWTGDVGAGAFDLGGVTVAGVLIHRCDRVTLRRVTVAGGLFLEGSTNFAMVGGSVGPGADFHPDVSAVYGAQPPIVPRNILFDGVRFHDWQVRTAGKHIECLQISDVQRLTVRGSSFVRCDTFDLHIAGTVGGPVRDVVIEDNFFGATSDHSGVTPAYYSLSVRNGIGVHITRNRSNQAWALPAAGDVVQRWVLSRNVAPMKAYQCDDRITYMHNRWSRAKCGPTDRPTR
ncbi:hypothetical protein [Baekduia alba]|uniref:hypothetical protein n=1 Tax=Baekduia alba TaxID=2997333 RepID=UPI0023413D8C|nr:hypothetical protein [Baekduia alba]